MGSRGWYIGTVMPPFFHVKARPRTLGQPGVVVTSVTRNVYLYGPGIYQVVGSGKACRFMVRALPWPISFAFFASTAITDGYVIYWNV